MTEGVIVAIIMSGGALAGSIINSVMIHRRKKLGNNPHPCRDHAEKIRVLDDKLDDIRERVSRIEGKLNGRR